MDSLLCDELLIEIFHRLPPSAAPALSLVSKRWLHLRRLSTAALSLSFPPPPPLSLPSLLSLHPFISSLSLSCSSVAAGTPSFDQLLLSAAASAPRTLKNLRLFAGPIASPATTLVSLSSYKPYLLSLSISLSRPLNFSFLSHFPSLSDFSVSVSPLSGSQSDAELFRLPELSSSLRLESLSVAGIGASDVGFGWLWLSLGGGCRLRRLRMRSCEGVGDGGEALASFQNCLRGVEEVELRTCRPIVDAVLLRLAENCDMLRSLLVYDGGSREGLLDFILNCKSDLERIDLRLPLDLDSEHLSAMASRFQSLKALKMQSSCLVTGDGLKNFSLAMGNTLQELALINCDVIEKVPGLLTTLGQNLRHLKKLDLSYNEMLNDKEFISMLASSNSLIELILRGCKRLTRASITSMLRNCKHLESLDIVHCCGLETETVELILGNLSWLRKMAVEQDKLSDVASDLASDRSVQLVG
ncbi:hypothetical protein V2J09_005535 [Rumex salicifolius]